MQSYKSPIAAASLRCDGHPAIQKLILKINFPISFK